MRNKIRNTLYSSDIFSAIVITFPDYPVVLGDQVSQVQSLEIDERPHDGEQYKSRELAVQIENLSASQLLEYSSVSKRQKSGASSLHERYVVSEGLSSTSGRIEKSSPTKTHAVSVMTVSSTLPRAAKFPILNSKTESYVTVEAPQLGTPLLFVNEFKKGVGELGDDESSVKTVPTIKTNVIKGELIVKSKTTSGSPEENGDVSTAVPKPLPEPTTAPAVDLQDLVPEIDNDDKAEDLTKSDKDSTSSSEAAGVTTDKDATKDDTGLTKGTKDDSSTSGSAESATTDKEKKKEKNPNSGGSGSGGGATYDKDTSGSGGAGAGAGSNLDGGDQSIVTNPPTAEPEESSSSEVVEASQSLQYISLIKAGYFIVVVAVLFAFLSIRDCMKRRGTDPVSQLEYKPLTQREDTVDIEAGGADEAWEEDWTDVPEPASNPGHSLSSSRSGSNRDFSLPLSSYSGEGGIALGSIAPQSNSNNSSSHGNGNSNGSNGIGSSGSSNGNGNSSGRISGSEPIRSIGALDLSRPAPRSTSISPSNDTSSTPTTPATGRRAISKPSPPVSSSDTDFFAVCLSLFGVRACPCLCV